jgi:hypothetical protein
MVNLAGIFGNNSIGYWHKLGKVDRALRHRSKSLLGAAFKNRRHYNLNKDNKFLEIIWGTPDQDRLNRCFSQIAYGIYYHHFSERFDGEIKVLLGYLHSTDDNHNSFMGFIKHRARIELKDVSSQGDNPDIFYYQFAEKDEHDLIFLQLRFYGGIDVYVSFMPAGKQFRMISE